MAEPAAGMTALDMTLEVYPQGLERLVALPNKRAINYGAGYIVVVFQNSLEIAPGFGTILKPLPMCVSGALVDHRGGALGHDPRRTSVVVSRPNGGRG